MCGTVLISSTQLTRQFKADERSHAMPKKNKPAVNLVPDCICQLLHERLHHRVSTLAHTPGTARQMHQTNIYLGREMTLPFAEHMRVPSSVWKTKKAQLPTRRRKPFEPPVI
jgi:hypothetical protein